MPLSIVFQLFRVDPF